MIAGRNARRPGAGPRGAAARYDARYDADPRGGVAYADPRRNAGAAFGKAEPSNIFCKVLRNAYGFFLL